MSTQLRAFRPLAASQNIAVTATAQTITLNYQIGTTSARFNVVGTENVFIRINDATSNNVATTATGMIIPAGNTEVFILGNGAVSISVIAAAPGSTLYVVQGEGL